MMHRIMGWLAALLAITLASAALAQAPSLAPTVAAPPPRAATQPASPAGQQAMTKADVDAWLDGFLPYALRNGDIAGAVVVVVKDGQVLTQRGFGYADVASRRAVDPDRTLFRPGSVSKLFTWTAVMQQVEAGKIDLDADVNGYLDFKIPPRNGKPVTMRQLMTHTAGFEERIKNIIFYDVKNLQPLGTYLKSWVPNRIFDAGTTPAYSNYATALAGYIVARVSGQSFDDYVDQRIFRPLAMTRSSFRQPLPPALAPLAATGYGRASEPAKGYEIVGPAPAGSLAATGADMARFMIAHLNQGAGLMRPETARLMHETPTTILPPLNRMRLGFYESPQNGREVISHGGDTQAFHSALHLFLDDNVGLFISVNSAGRYGAPGSIRTALLQDFADRYFPAPRRDGTVDAKTSAEHARMMAGRWQASRRGEGGFVDALGLVGQTVITVGAKGELVIPDLKDAGGGTRKWVEIAPFVWRQVGGVDRLAAKVVDGKVVRWSFDPLSAIAVYDRVPAGRNAAWVLPALFAAMGVLLLTFLHWPAAALVRRSYKAPLPLEGRTRTAYRGVRLAAGLVLAVLVGWLLLATTMMGDLSALTSKSDGMLWTMQIAGLIVFVGAVLLAGWNLLLALRDGRRWTGKLWAVLLLLSTIMVLYVAAVFGLLDMTVEY